MKITRQQLTRLIREELSHSINEDDVGRPILSHSHGGDVYSHTHGGDADSATLEAIFGMANEMAGYAIVIQNESLRSQLLELIVSIGDVVQIE